MVGRLGISRVGLVVPGVVCLLMILGVQLALSVRRESQTWDEGNHIFAGYMSWTAQILGSIQSIRQC